MSKGFMICAAALLVVPLRTAADNITPRPTLLVSGQATIKGERIVLGEIAKIFSVDPVFSGLVAQLKQLDLGESPPPGTTTTLVGANILAALTAEGIPADALGYSIPQAVVVRREGREVTNAEVLSAARRAITREQGLDLQVREVNWSNPQIIPTGRTELAVVRSGEASGGRLPVRVDVTVDGTPAARFVAQALVDDWREVPVLSRSVQRGSVIAAEDLQMVRLNMLKQPLDVASHLQQVIGRRVKSDMAAGEAVRKNQLLIPPVIARGRKVRMVYRSGGFEATATGVAVDDGFEGGPLKVRNDSSKRIVEAVVSSPDEVIVKAE